MRDIIHSNHHWDDNSEELSQGECVLGNILAAAVSCRGSTGCVCTLAKPQACPFRDEGLKPSAGAETSSQRPISQGQAANNSKVSKA